MAHNPFNDLYVESLEDVMRSARSSWELAASICYRQEKHLRTTTQSESVQLAESTPPAASNLHSGDAVIRFDREDED